MGSTIGLYFPMNNDEVNALRSRLNALAGELGYVAKAGPTTGDGNLAALLVAIDVGEVFVAKVEHRCTDEQLKT